MRNLLIAVALLLPLTSLAVPALLQMPAAPAPLTKPAAQAVPAKPPVVLQLREMKDMRPGTFYVRPLPGGNIVVSKQDEETFSFDFFNPDGTFRGSVPSTFHTSEIYGITDYSLVAFKGNDAYIVNLKTQTATLADTIEFDSLYAHYQITKANQLWTFHLDIEHHATLARIYDNEGHKLHELTIPFKVWKTAPLANGSVLLTNFTLLAAPTDFLIVNSEGATIKQWSTEDSTIVRVIGNKIFARLSGEPCEGREYNELGNFTSGRPDFCSPYHMFNLSPFFVTSTEIIASVADKDQNLKPWLLRFDLDGRLKKKTRIKTQAPGGGRYPWSALSNGGFARATQNGVELYDTEGNFLKTFSPDFYARTSFLEGDIVAIGLGKTVTFYNVTGLTAALETKLNICYFP
ncbi:MAG: hypothetical protein ACXVBE_16015 [Bdellovibrionota bacterium]